MPREHIHFVTGRLAEHALKNIVAPLAAAGDFDYTVDVLPITVAALMTPKWIANHWSVPEAATRVLVPGYCGDDLRPLTSRTSANVERGPRDLRRLPQYFRQEALPPDYGRFDIEIIAEINHCPRLTLKDILREAAQLASDGADVIDVGCDPDGPWPGVGDAVKAIRDAGLRAAIDSFDPQEIALAVAAGAELVLSVNSSNREAAVEWGVEVVATPDVPATLEGFDATLDYLENAGVPMRIDPVLEPIGFGFAASLGRYLEVRQKRPDAAMMMGIGNLTELTEVDAAGVNAVLLGFCQEAGIRSVLTTQVINWARTSVKECDVARRLMHHAVNQRILPKHVDQRLVMLRDAAIDETPIEFLQELAEQIRDASYRIFAAAGQVHLVGAGLHLHDEDPFALMERLRGAGPAKSLDPSHAFYLGYEMCKAATALRLGKTYVQDESLDWGLASWSEARHYLQRRPAAADARDEAP